MQSVARQVSSVAGCKMSGIALGGIVCVIFIAKMSVGMHTFIEKLWL